MHGRVVESNDIFCIFFLLFIKHTVFISLTFVCWFKFAFFRTMRLILIREHVVFLILILSRWVSCHSISRLQFFWHDILHSFINWFWQLHIWDFSGKLNKIVMNEGLSYPNDSPRQPSREVSSLRPVLIIIFLNIFFITF